MINEIVQEIRGALRHRNLFYQVFDVIVHKIKINTSPIDYYRYKFYRKNMTWDEKSRYLGKRCSNFYPYQANSVQFVSLFDNKYIFSTMLSGFGIPHPKLFATIGEDYQIKTYSEFKSFMEHTKKDMVLKPLDGSGGKGVIVLSYRNKEYCTLERACSAEHIWEKITLGKKFPKPYLVEERVEQHPLISNLYPHSLNTLRVITVKTKDKEWNLMAALMRVGQKGQIDNLGEGGILGSILILLDNDGKIRLAYDCSVHRQISLHPVTKAKLLDFQVPQYHDAISLALKTSERFSFMGTIGWDIGLSKDGPVVIEGNIFYDCLPWQLWGQTPLVPPEIAPKLSKKKWWSRWDKTALHPRANRRKIKA